MAGYEYNGKIRHGPSKRLLQLESIDARHPHVRDSTVDVIADRVFEKLLRRRKRNYFNPGGLDDLRQGSARRIVVIDEGNFYRSAYVAIGVGLADRPGIRFNRQCKLHRRAAVRILYCPEATAVILDYRFHYDEAHAHPGRFGREERVE